MTSDRGTHHPVRHTQPHTTAHNQTKMTELKAEMWELSICLDIIHSRFQTIRELYFPSLGAAINVLDNNMNIVTESVESRYKPQVIPKGLEFLEQPPPKFIAEFELNPARSAEIQAVIAAKRTLDESKKSVIPFLKEFYPKPF